MLRVDRHRKDMIVIIHLSCLHGSHDTFPQGRPNGKQRRLGGFHGIPLI